ncbi:hypothetical protein ACFX16_038182 [Malus domestica]
MQEMDGFVAAHPKRVVHRKTTHTQLLGAAPTNQNTEGFKFWEGSDLGVLDGGIEPIHPSCSGAGIPPPPTKWKGRCDFNASDCNNKLIGPKAFNIAAEALKERSLRNRLI